MTYKSTDEMLDSFLWLITDLGASVIYNTSETFEHSVRVSIAASICVH